MTEEPKPSSSSWSRFVPVFNSIITKLALLAVVLVGPTKTWAQVPSLIHYQGRVGVAGSAFDGTGQFKFALVNADATTVFWRSAADGDANGEPDLAVSVPVTKGLFSVQLGDTALPNMAALPSTVFVNPQVYIRVWFNDGVSGFQRLIPDQRIAAVGYALMAANVADGAITTAKLGGDVFTTINNSIAAAAPSGLMVASVSSSDATLLASGYKPSGSLPAPAWVNLATTDAPSARFDHTSIWNGSSLLIWGGNIGAGLFTGTGSLYRPEIDQWSLLSPVDAPIARSGHIAVWSGSEMIVWGGFGTPGYLNTGGRYNPNTLLWTALPTSGAPTGRVGAIAIWTGTRLLVWGGRNSSGVQGDGALFNPSTSAWETFSLPNAPTPRFGASAVFTGSKILVWGGDGSADALDSGSELLINAGGLPTEWRSLTTIGAPSPRSGHSAVWTGSKMLIWGGKRGSTFAGDGASFDPTAGTWQSIASAGAPSPRASAAASWTGSEWVIIGGEMTGGVTATSGAYDPTANSWRTLSNPGSPIARSSATATWTGSSVVVFGGKSGATPIASGQSVSPQPTFHLYRKP